MSQSQSLLLYQIVSLYLRLVILSSAMVYRPLSLPQHRLSPPRTLGECSKFQIGYYTPQARREWKGTLMLHLSDLCAPGGCSKKHPRPSGRGFSKQRQLLWMLRPFLMKTYVFLDHFRRHFVPAVRAKYPSSQNSPPHNCFFTLGNSFRISLALTAFSIPTTLLPSISNTSAENL